MIDAHHVDDSLVADASATSELLNEAYAFHEFTASRIEGVMDWLEARSLAADLGVKILQLWSRPLEIFARSASLNFGKYWQIGKS